VRLAFDCTYALSPRTGVGTFADAVLGRLAARADVDVRGYAVAGPAWAAAGGSVGHGVRVGARSRLLSPRWARAAWRRGDVPPIEWITGRVEVAHSPNFVAPPTRRAASVATVHDLTFVHHPQWCTTDTVDWFGPLIAAAVRRGAWIHTVSAHVAAEVVDAFGADPERVRFVPNAADPLPPADPADGARLAGAERYVVALGTIEPRKNLGRLVAAFDAVAATDPDLRLVVAGGRGWDTDAYDAAVAASPHRGRIVELGRVDDHQRAALVRGALAMAYVSLYEGFGIPPLEAMGVGTPVLAADVGAIRETCGDAARYADPTDVDDLAAGLAEITSDEALRTRLAAAGRQRADQFSWDATTDGLVQLYADAIAERGRRR
jgi:glycosyltransferase involved in cell wall biosynthesis